jgi:DNA/RNA endonuclease G (NUC1)
MKKLLSILAITLFATTAQAWEQWPPQAIASCQVHAPYGFPKAKTQGVGICRHAYVTLNDTEAKIPVWVSYTLTPQNALGCVKRSNGFAPDQSLPKANVPN